MIIEARLRDDGGQEVLINARPVWSLDGEAAETIANEHDIRAAEQTAVVAEEHLHVHIINSLICAMTAEAVGAIAAGHITRWSIAL